MAGKNFVMINAPAMGHIIPMIELAYRISAYHHVTVIISKSFVPKLTQRDIIGARGNSNFHLIPLEDGMPDDNEKVSQTPGMARILAAVEIMRQPIETLLENMPLNRTESVSEWQLHAGEQLAKLGVGQMRPVDAVIFDHFLSGIVPKICHQRGVANFEVNPASGFRSSHYTNKPEPPATGNSTEGAAVAQWWQMKRDAEPFLTGQLLNSFREGQPASPGEFNMKTFFVGPLFPLETVPVEPTPAVQEITQFLDKLPNKSMVYFAFGTVVRAIPQQIVEIYRALTGLNRPYIWSLAEQLHRFLPEDRVPNDELHQILPWVPQKTILQHPAVRIFVTHGGWNSTVEGVACGLPMVVWPGFADQHDNAAWVENIGVGVAVPNTKTGPDGRIVPASEITEWIDKVAEWDAADGVSPFAAKCAEWQNIVSQAQQEGGSSWKNLHSLMNMDFSS